MQHEESLKKQSITKPFNAMANHRKNTMFTHVPGPKVPRNVFDLSHEVKMSGKFGYLYPVLCVETMPGDTMKDRVNVFLRMAPMLAPIMHLVKVYVHSFFVPVRLLTYAYESFFTGGQDGVDTPILPYLRVDQVAAAQSEFNILGLGSLWDYLGLPPNFEGPLPGVVTQEEISVLPFRACAKVWNDWYRDPNFDTEFDLQFDQLGNVTAGSVNEGGIMDIRKYRRAFEKDYFTSALESPQRGAEVLIPLSAVATDVDITYKDGAILRNSSGTPLANLNEDLFTDATGEWQVPPAVPVRVDNIEEITLDNASSTINDLRTAFALQRWAEANARGGPRYIEVVRSQFGVSVPDYRLQRSEYLGGGRAPVQISEVQQTAQSDSGPDGKGVGDLWGHGVSVGAHKPWTYNCDEHGFVVSFLSVTYATAYSQGISRMWSRRSKFDYPWPLLANLGEQEIRSKELFFSYDNADAAENQEVFGYIPRYSEYKYHPDCVKGDFRNTLIIWHLQRYFTERPVLGSEFTSIHEEGTEGDPSLFEASARRIFQVTDGTDYLWIQLYHHLTAKRPLPYFGVPSGI